MDEYRWLWMNCMILGGPRLPWIIMGSFVYPLILNVPGFLRMAIKGPSCLLMIHGVEHFWVTLGALMALLAWVFLMGSDGCGWF